MICILALHLADTLAAAEDAVPRDFKIVASCVIPGTAQYPSWETSIFSDGTVIQRFRDNTNEKNKGDLDLRRFAKLSHKDIIELYKIVKRARFFSLPAEMYGYGGEDGPSIALVVTMNGKTHEFISGNGPGDKEKWDRVGMVFSAIDEKVPSPYDDNGDAMRPESEVRPTPHPPSKSLPARVPQGGRDQ